MTAPDEQTRSADRQELTDMVGKLISMMESGGISSLELEHGDLKLSLKAGSRKSAPSAMVAVQQASAPVAGTVAAPPVEEPAGHVVTSPMIGTFYVAPAPNEPPFISVGDQVSEGQTIGIVEAMKIMNEIAADRAGSVVEIIARDGQTVEYGSPLVLIDPAGE